MYGILLSERDLKLKEQHLQQGLIRFFYAGLLLSLLEISNHNERTRITFLQRHPFVRCRSTPARRSSARWGQTCPVTLPNRCHSEGKAVNTALCIRCIYSIEGNKDFYPSIDQYQGTESLQHCLKTKYIVRSSRNS